MITELRENLDVVIVIIVALVLFHVYKKYVKGETKGISK